VGELVRSWLPAAAPIWCDMERGLYKWDGKPPLNADGCYRVVRKQILKGCGTVQDPSR
jgi:hypothetical protein